MKMKYNARSTRSMRYASLTRITPDAINRDAIVAICSDRVFADVTRNSTGEFEWNRIRYANAK